MRIRNPRSRTISIRLSEEEYVRLKRLSAITGARSVSDLTRDAMGMILGGRNRDELTHIPMDEFRATLKTLERKIDELKTRLVSEMPNKSL